MAEPTLTLLRIVALRPERSRSGITSAAEPLPLVIVGHRYTLRDPVYYLTWIEHLVRRGAVVLYAEYQANATDYAVYRQNFLDDVRNALAALQREGVAVDLEAALVSGHSVGGVLAADYAASATVVRLRAWQHPRAALHGCLERRGTGCGGARHRRPGVDPSRSGAIRAHYPRITADGLNSGQPSEPGRSFLSRGGIAP